MAEISWCARKKGGLALVEPGKNLAEGYLQKAENALESARTEKIEEWKITKSYYAMYFSLYALLQRIGIKCEIHACTIAFARHFLADYFTPKEMDFLEGSLTARIDSQYFVNKEVPDEIFKKVLEAAPGFFVKCKGIINSLDENKALEIREKFAKACKKYKA